MNQPAAFGLSKHRIEALTDGIYAVAVAIAIVLPGAGNMAFMLMTVIMPVSRRIEARPAPSTESRFLNT